MLQKELSDVQALIAQLQEEAASVAARLSLQQERERLLRRLLELDGAPRPVSPSRNLSDEVEAVLQDSAIPLHISNIREKLLEKGVQIPGKGLDANVIARIGKDPRFVRVSGKRGFYTLTGIDQPVPKPMAPARRRRRKRSKRKPDRRIIKSAGAHTPGPSTN